MKATKKGYKPKHNKKEVVPMYNPEVSNHVRMVGRAELRRRMFEAKKEGIIDARGE